MVGLAILSGLAAFARVSRREREGRASAIAGVLALVLPVGCFVAAGGPLAVRIGILAGIAACLLVVPLLGRLPMGAPRTPGGRPERRVDERDLMFARAILVPGSSNYEAYYAMRPEKRAGDESTRALPGLLSPRAPRAEPVAFASARASFDTIEQLRKEIDGPVAAERLNRPPATLAGAVKRLAFELGALDVGIARLRPYHLYSHIGRGSGVWGAPVDLAHAWAIAFTVEMDHATMRCAPAAPVLAETARRYAESARIAVRLAERIRAWGHPARAHIARDYRVIAPLVGQDAGLGEIGRMGILITPRLGPRVRIAVVTTDLPLLQDPPGDDGTVIDFCAICKKCAENCPSESIPSGDREPIDDALRWAIDPDACFRYWSATGTDCGRCMTVCRSPRPARNPRAS